jgi:hypothetical protein
MLYDNTYDSNGQAEYMKRLFLQLLSINIDVSAYIPVTPASMPVGKMPSGETT